MVIDAPPSVLTEVISLTPAICPKRRSNGAATEEATVAGSAPGSEAQTWTIGNPTRGVGATARNRYATMPSKNNPPASKDVPTGRRMKGPEMFMRAPKPLRLILRKASQELLRPQPALTEQSDL